MKAISLHFLLEANSSDHSQTCLSGMSQRCEFTVCPGMTLDVCESDRRSCSSCVFGNRDAHLIAEFWAKRNCQSWA